MCWKWPGLNLLPRPGDILQALWWIAAEQGTGRQHICYMGGTSKRQMQEEGDIGRPSSQGLKGAGVSENEDMEWIE